MPSLFRATVGLKEPQWAWHRQNPGRLSRLCQLAVDREIALEALPDTKRLAIEDSAQEKFFNERFPGLEGDYIICGNRLSRGEATDEQMATDAQRFGVLPSELIDYLDREYWKELQIALLRAF